jgi:hypothetical protein
LAFLTQNKAKLCKILIIALVFDKNASLFAENCQKSQKIVIITSTPGRPVTNIREASLGNKLELWVNLGNWEIE